MPLIQLKFWSANSYHDLKDNGFSLLVLAVPGFLVAVFLLKRFWAENRSAEQTFYNVYFHPLAKVPGPCFAKVNGSYMAPAQAMLCRAQTLLELHKRYGSVVRIGPGEVSISDWKTYREIYSHGASTKQKDFYEATRLAGHDNVFTMIHKDAHASRRKIQEKSYSQQNILTNESLIADKAEILTRRMAKGSQHGHSVDAFRLVGLFSLEVILACAYNRQHGDEPTDECTTLLTAMDASAVAIITSAAVPGLKRSVGRRLPGSIGKAFRQWDSWQKITTNLLDTFQQHELAQDKTGRFMTTPLLLSVDKHLGRKLKRDELIEELMGLTFAGSGTTSTTLTYLLYALAKDSDRQERLREELRSSAGDSLNELQPLPYLNAVIKETLRLYPTIMSTLPRVLNKPLVVDKHLLPVGTSVGMQNYVHHRDPNLYPQPDEFCPERWLMDDAVKLKDMDAGLTPFSLGPYNCIGQNLARAELYLAVGRVFRGLKLTLNATMKDSDMELEDRFNIAPRGRRLLFDVKIV
ncbi:hypothetical protein LTR84_004493 [Exophiala bonariae]|uniref:Cytochrome P450 monooxygenase n=1 Tax=Exophiala bonariae TaxID=1690606 RepID=A0AAV9N8Z5_9EURO|nr:hypothetical protein LTR84_004493 [Exophiala bonariae]